MYRFYLFVTKKCNQNCLFCVRKGKNEETLKEPTIEEIKQQIDNVSAKYDEIQLLLDGGEPTLRKDINEIISYASAKSAIKSITILTNGVLLSDESYLEKLINSSQGKISFSVSLHSHKKEISEFLTQALGTYEKTIKGIKNIVKKNIPISIYFVITKQNYKDLDGFVEFMHKEFPSIKWLTFSFIYPQGNALLNPFIFPKYSDVKPKLNSALKLAEKYGINLSFTTCGLMPFCMIEGYEGKVYRQMIDDLKTAKVWDSSSGYRNYELADDKWHEGTKIKSRVCDFCVLSFACKGIWKFYTKIYGTEELKPIIVNKERIFKIKLYEENNLEKIIKEILSFGRKKIIFIDAKIRKEDLENLKEYGKKIYHIVTILENSSIIFRFLRPLPRCMFTDEEWETIKKYSPKNCLDCPMLYINRDGKIVGCWGGEIKLESYKNRKEIFETHKNEISNNMKILEICKNCSYRKNGECQGFCILNIGVENDLDHTT